MLDQNFCTFLEYELCNAFKNSNYKEVEGFWCDGVLLSEPDYYYSQKLINDNRQAKLRAFISKTGQTEYKLILKFGNKALSRYARGLSIQEYLPGSAAENWFRIDLEKQEIEIQLQ